MFFTRFEETSTTEHDTSSQRLEVLKQKISARKQELQNTQCSQSNKCELPSKIDTVDNGVEPMHPKKRRKISRKNDKDSWSEITSESKADQRGTLESSTKELDVGQSGEIRKKKKKKKKTNCSEEENETTVLTVEESTKVSRDVKKKKKKRKASSEVCDKGKIMNNVESNGAVDSEDTFPPHLDESLKEQSVISKKKKKTKKKVEPVNDNCVTDTNSTKAEATASNANDTTLQVPNEEYKKDSIGEQGKVDHKEEEWTILGKHKKLQKVGNVKRDLPDWIVNGEIVDTDLQKTTPLSDFGLLDPCLVEILDKMEITSLFPVQSHIIPDILAGCQEISLLSRNFTPPSDLCVSAPTGSGKTLVYALPLVQCLYKLPPLLQAIVVLPTKNLANQVKTVLSFFGKLIKVVLLSGKDTFPTEQKHLFTEQGSCLAHIVVTTPGRLVNHLRETPLFTLQHLRFLVIDEMDTLLNQTYQDWLPSLFSSVYNANPYKHPYQPEIQTTRYPPKTRLSVEQLTQHALPLQKLLFSATVTHDPSKLAPLQLYQPKLYSCGGKYTIPGSLTQYQIRCEIQDKALVLVHLVRQLGHILCFTSSVDTANRLALLTEEFGGMKVAEYSSTLTSQQRNKVVRDFDLNHIQLLVCSDSLARGMDLTSVDHVINYDVPAHVQTYVHRVGRTARAGKPGTAYTLVRHEEVRNFHKLLKKAGNTRAKEMKIPEETIAELSVGYEDCLSRLETRLKSKGRKG